ncbi:MAG: hypothetical protein JSU81_00165 [Candidatus Coatesbacteria bacterium]|nr:MAG: hypothetical protein JSU81_00165 [Candidatus Coatesbacteria bacterium]
MNLGLLLQAGHYYQYNKSTPRAHDQSEFDIRDAELAVTGTFLGDITYGVRSRRFSSLREAFVGVELSPHFSAAAGLIFAPFGAEAMIYERDLMCSSRAFSSTYIAPGRETGVRCAYDLTRDEWPYTINVEVGVFNGEGPLVNGAGRVYGTPLPRVRTFRVGCSYFYAKEGRQKYTGTHTPEFHYYEEPRFGVDVAYSLAGVTFTAEYMQWFINDYPVKINDQYWPFFAYKDAYYRGYFATVDYHRKLRWRYFQGIQPYLRYERWEPPLVERGYIPERRYTGGFALLFLGRNLMFRSDYTRIVEDSYATTNDCVASEFQVSF